MVKVMNRKYIIGYSGLEKEMRVTNNVFENENPLATRGFSCRRMEMFSNY